METPERDEVLAQDIARLLELAGEDEVPDEAVTSEPPSFDDQPPSPSSIHTTAATPVMQIAIASTSACTPSTAATAVTAMAASITKAHTSPKLEQAAEERRVVKEGDDEESLMPFFSSICASIAVSAVLTFSSVLLMPTLEAYRYAPPNAGVDHYGSLQRVASGDALFPALEFSLESLQLEIEEPPSEGGRSSEDAAHTMSARGSSSPENALTQPPAWTADTPSTPTTSSSASLPAAASSRKQKQRQKSAPPPPPPPKTVVEELVPTTQPPPPSTQPPQRQRQRQKQPPKQPPQQQQQPQPSQATARARGITLTEGGVSPTAVAVEAVAVPPPTDPSAVDAVAVPPPTDPSAVDAVAVPPPTDSSAVPSAVDAVAVPQAAVVRVSTSSSGSAGAGSSEQRAHGHAGTKHDAGKAHEHEGGRGKHGGSAGSKAATDKGL
jgi:hypothetical protein